jgi:hypothetical protein
MHGRRRLMRVARSSPPRDLAVYRAAQADRHGVFGSSQWRGLEPLAAIAKICVGLAPIRI